jgi:hypothetical protein
MNNKLLNQAIEKDSFIEDACNDLIKRARKIAQILFHQVKQGMNEIDVKRWEHQRKQQQVYRSSIERMSKIEKLRMGLYRD